MPFLFCLLSVACHILVIRGEALVLANRLLESTGFEKMAAGPVLANLVSLNFILANKEFLFMVLTFLCLSPSYYVSNKQSEETEGKQLHFWSVSLVILQRASASHLKWWCRFNHEC